MVRSYLRAADSVLLVSNVRRATNDKTVKDWLAPSLRRTLLASGRFGDLAFAVTQTDCLVRVCVEPASLH